MHRVCLTGIDRYCFHRMPSLSAFHDRYSRTGRPQAAWPSGYVWAGKRQAVAWIGGEASALTHSTTQWPVSRAALACLLMDLQDIDSLQVIGIMKPMSC